MLLRKKKSSSRLIAGSNIDFSRSISMPVDKILNTRTNSDQSPTVIQTPSPPELE